MLHSMEIITRKQAKERGLAHYYTGIECENGHLSKRGTKSKKCLACHREARARLRASDPDRIKAQKAADYLRHREARLAQVTAYQAANREKIRLRSKAFRQANKGRISERFKAWAKANRPIMRIHERRRRDRERGATGSHTYAEVKALEVAQAMLCANRFCRADLSAGYHQDHILPIVLGGTDDIANIQLLCGPCNLSKGDLHPDEWQKRLEEAHGQLPQIPMLGAPNGC